MYIWFKNAFRHGFPKSQLRSFSCWAFTPIIHVPKLHWCMFTNGSHSATQIMFQQRNECSYRKSNRHGKSCLKGISQSPKRNVCSSRRSRRTMNQFLCLQTFYYRQKFAFWNGTAYTIFQKWTAFESVGSSKIFNLGNEVVIPHWWSLEDRVCTVLWFYKGLETANWNMLSFGVLLFICNTSFCSFLLGELHSTLTFRLVFGKIVGFISTSTQMFQFRIVPWFSLFVWKGICTVCCTSFLHESIHVCCDCLGLSVLPLQCVSSNLFALCDQVKLLTHKRVSEKRDSFLSHEREWSVKSYKCIETSDWHSPCIVNLAHLGLCVPDWYWTWCTKKKKKCCSS